MEAGIVEAINRLDLTMSIIGLANVLCLYAMIFAIKQR